MLAVLCLTFVKGLEPYPPSRFDRVIPITIDADDPVIEGRGRAERIEYVAEFSGTLHAWTGAADSSTTDAWLRIENADGTLVERLNLVKRTCCSLIRRRTASPARRAASLQAALEVVRLVYNYVRPHSWLRTKYGKRTSAMAAGLTTRPPRVLEVLRWVVPGEYLAKQRMLEAIGPS